MDLVVDLPVKWLVQLRVGVEEGKKPNRESVCGELRQVIS
jgi:hypothetical protein